MHLFVMAIIPIVVSICLAVTTLLTSAKSSAGTNLAWWMLAGVWFVIVVFWGFLFWQVRTVSKIGEIVPEQDATPSGDSSSEAADQSKQGEAVDEEGKKEDGQ